MIPFNKPYCSGRELEYINEVCHSMTMSGNGTFTKKCHSFFEEKYGFKKCLLTTSATDALEMCAMLCDLQENDEVIVPSYTFVSTALAFMRERANIKFADSGKDSPNITAENIKPLITSRTKVIVVVHYAGISCDMDAIMELAEKGAIVTMDEKTGVFTLNKNYDNEKYDEKLMKSWIKDIASGIKFLHDNNIAHCDIKSDNIVLDKDGRCKLGDFGNSLRINEVDNDNFLRTQGNIYFFPPELVDEREKDKKSIDYRPVDIWTLGVSIYTCIYKSLPFVPEVRDNIVELFKTIDKADFDYNKNGITISDEMKTLLKHILEKDPEKRFTADDILNYPWLNEK